MCFTGMVRGGGSGCARGLPMLARETSQSLMQRKKRLQLDYSWRREFGPYQSSGKGGGTDRCASEDVADLFARATRV